MWVESWLTNRHKEYIGQSCDQWDATRICTISKSTIWLQMEDTNGNIPKFPNDKNVNGLVSDENANKEYRYANSAQKKFNTKNVRLYNVVEKGHAEILF